VSASLLKEYPLKIKLLIIALLFAICFPVFAIPTLFNGTILFENGSGVTLSEWTQNKQFLNCARKTGRLFFYNRAIPTKPLTPQDVNAYLLLQLKEQHIKPPYILVAHSYGALYSLYFARKYPELIRGVLLVDPVPNNYEWTDAFLKENNLPKNKMPAELYYQLKGFQEAKIQVNNLPPLRNHIPVIIISSSDMEKNAPIKGDWFAQQKQWLNQNPHSKIFSVKSGHFIQLEHPALVCEKLKMLKDDLS
jgi:pimeloyl-ACP methyl ester carboxylesterase